MPIAEFRAFGYPQQVNRLLLHPLRLAIKVVVAEDGTESLGGAWAYRQDPEGVYSAATHDLGKAHRDARRTVAAAPLDCDRLASRA
jgi:hypothetical protein